MPRSRLPNDFDDEFIMGIAVVKRCNAAFRSTRFLHSAPFARCTSRLIPDHAFAHTHRNPRFRFSMRLLNFSHPLTDAQKKSLRLANHNVADLPPIVRLRPMSNVTLPRFEVAEIIDLNAI